MTHHALAQARWRLKQPELSKEEIVQWAQDAVEAGRKAKTSPRFLSADRHHARRKGTGEVIRYVWPEDESCVLVMRKAPTARSTRPDWIVLTVMTPTYPKKS